MKIFRLLFISLVIFSSCKEKEKPVTREEAKQFAESLEKTIAKRNEDFFNDAFSLNEIIKIIETKVKNISKKELNGLKSGMASKLNTLGTQIVATLGETGTYQLVRMYEKDAEQHLIFRIYDDGKLNYHDIRLIHEKGKVKIADMFIYASGENFSETLAAVFSGMLNNGLDAKAQNTADELAAIRVLMNKKKHEEAMEKMDNLPKEMKELRAVQLVRVHIAMEMDNDSIYIKVIDEFNALYPNNGKMGLLLLDGYILHKQYDKALYCVNQVDSQINKDPMLDYYRAMCYNLKEDKAAARTCLERLDNAMPDFTDGQVELAYNYCETKDWEEAGKLINKIKNRRDFKKTMLTQFKYIYPDMEKYITD